MKFPPATLKQEPALAYGEIKNESL